MFSQRLDRCRDSHVHWAGLGESLDELKLNHLGYPQAVAGLKPQPHHYRGRWLTGFGWNQNSWPDKAFPTRESLDAVFSETPVAFFRADGHALWVNSLALREAGLLNSQEEATSIREPYGGKILRDNLGRPTGVLIDAAMGLIEQHIPAPGPQDMQRWLLKGMRHFNQSGFTHIRDVTSTALQWQQSCHLADSGVLTLAVETFFGAYRADEFDQALRLAMAARKERHHLLRVCGVKVFLDGALGSEGAWLSRPYLSGSGQGLQLLPDGQLKEFMRRCFEVDLAIAVHVIGDEAVAKAVQIHSDLAADGLHGELHLEHVELARPETIAQMAGKNITCHFQPCHWLSDKAWLNDKIGPLTQYLFPWRQMQTLEVAFTFGSDAPIERASVAENLRALSDIAEAGVAKLLGDPLRYHQHPDVAWVPNTYTLFENGLPKEVVFAGEHIL